MSGYLEIPDDLIPRDTEGPFINIRFSVYDEATAETVWWIDLPHRSCREGDIELRLSGRVTDEGTFAIGETVEQTITQGAVIGGSDNDGAGNAIHKEYQG